MLTNLDAGQFRAFGFVVLKNCLTQQEVAEIARAYKRVMAGAPKYDYFGSKGTRMQLDFVEEDDTFAQLVAHPRVMEAMRDIWGAECLYVGSDIWSNRDDTPWHSDGQPGRQMRSLKVTNYLDPMTAAQGALKVIPGSHHASYCASIMQECGVWKGSSPRLRLETQQIPGAVAIETKPSDIVIWDNRIWHSAWKRKDGKARRALFIAYVPDPGSDMLATDDLRQFLKPNVFIARSEKHKFLYGKRLLNKGGPVVQKMAARIEQLTGCRVHKEK